MFEGFATVAKLILALLLAHSLALKLLVLHNPEKYLDKDLRVLITHETEKANYYMINLVSFNLHARSNITMVISPYELKYLNKCLNTILRLLLSNQFNVTLIIPNYEWKPINITSKSIISYCWGPNCGTVNLKPSKVKIVDNPIGSYQFMRYTLSNVFGLAGKIEALLLLKDGKLYSMKLQKGVWLNGHLISIGSYLVPYYCIQPTNFILMLESAYGR